MLISLPASRNYRHCYRTAGIADGRVRSVWLLQAVNVPDSNTGRTYDILPETMTKQNTRF